MKLLSVKIKWMLISYDIARLLNEDLVRIRLKTRAFEHVLRHTWHALPYGEELGLTRYEKMEKDGQHGNRRSTAK
jgi:hypothetical protein